MRLQTICPRCETWVETEMDKDGDAVCPKCENTFHSDYYDTPQKRISDLEAQLAGMKARLEAYEEGFEPKTKKPKPISDLEDEVVIFKDKMGRPYIGVFDNCIHKWCCITATQFIFSTDAIDRWFPLPGRRGE